ncbi:MAG: SDR family oxidoreductase [Helicobacteraceae bacterium]|nr:SDR family oxidoreductase [Helicobacteraceae bacterium]
MNKKVFIITGTSKGIGKELCLYYLNKDYIVCGCARGKSSINHKNYTHFIMDINDESSVISMVRDIVKKYKSIDVLINNAGIASMNHILTTPYNTIKNIFNTNVFGSFLFIREVSKAMSIDFKNKKRILKKNQSFMDDNLPYYRIINFATIATPLRLEGEAIYAASKASIINLTQIAAKELSSFNITINAIAPTPIKTNLIKAIPKDKIDSLLNKQAIKRFGNIKDISNVCDFFIDKKSDFITGQIIYLGGVNG